MSRASTLTPRPARSRARRWLLAGLGVVCVGVGAIGAVVPGLPTTVFLIAASWLFARSCPWLEERLIRIPLFRPFLGYLDGNGSMPRRAVVTTLVVMWLAIAASALIVGLGEPNRPVVAAVIVALGFVGSGFVVRLGRRRVAEPAASSEGFGRGETGTRPTTTCDVREQPSSSLLET